MLLESTGLKRVTMQYLDELAIFIYVVQEGSFTAASRRLNLPTTSVSRKLAQLEEKLGSRLLLRTTRKIKLTDIGQAYFDRCQPLLESLEAATNNIQQYINKPQGELKVSAPITLASILLADPINQFMLEYPDIRINLILNNDQINPVEQGVDVAFFGGDLPDSNMVARPLGSFSYGIFASPNYLAKAPELLHPKQLPEHQLLLTWPLQSWHFSKDGDEHIEIQGPARLQVNEIRTAINAACKGLGVINVPIQFTQQELQQGLLVQLLPEWQTAVRTISMVYHSRTQLPCKVRVFIDYMLDNASKLFS